MELSSQATDDSFGDKFFRGGAGSSIVEVLTSRPTPEYSWVQRAWLAILFLGGLYLWGYFLNQGRGPLDYHDWVYISAPRLTFMREAILRGELPLHLSAPATDRDVTRRFLAIPDQILSPQILLLRWISVSRFVLLHFWLMYTLGFGGLLLLRRRFGLSLLAFTILFALFSFNGNILSHVSVGHASWGGYFLFTGFAWLIFELLEGKANWRWIARVAFLSFFILLQGSYHQFVWMLFFIGLLALSVRRHFWLLLVTALFTVLIATVSILPAILLVGRISNEFTAGYLLLQSIWQWLTQPQIPNDLTNNIGLTKPIGTWEYTFFIGIPAGLFILYFGVVRSFLEGEDPFHLRALIPPCLGLIMLSIDAVFKTLRLLMPIPLFTGERVSARIFSLAFVFILIAASIQFQHWLDKKRPSPASVLAMALAVGMGANDLMTNLSLWSVKNAAKYFPTLYFDPKLYYPVNQ